MGKKGYIIGKDVKIQVEEIKLGDEIVYKRKKEKLEDRDRDIYWTNYWDCEFYDETAKRKCLAYDYEDCNNTRAHKCKFAKMQDMEKHIGIATHISFDWNKGSKKGIINFLEGYTKYARLELEDIEEYEFKFLYNIIRKRGKMIDEYGQPLRKDSFEYYQNE